MKNIFNTKQDKNTKKSTSDSTLKELSMKLSKDYIDGKIEMSEMKKILIKHSGMLVS